MSVKNRKALVLFSGGQDSTTCLAWTLSQFDRVETVGFAYGQRHAAELDARPNILRRIRDEFLQWRDRLGEDHVLALDVLSQIGGSALTDEIAIAMRSDGLPTTFVPGRNLMFLTAAAALGTRREAYDLVGGMCETDYSGYPDCRDETMQAMQRAITLGFAQAFTIHTPLMKIDKAETWRLAKRLGGEVLVNIIIEDTVTCYQGDRSHRQVWGYGCGACPACDLRAAGYLRYRGVAA
jgi:7-cyano-7-deazaguanine synthase